MHIIADEKIYQIKAHLAPYGTVTCLPGHKITAKILKTADALMVRTVTPIHAHLLDQSAVQFVGSATAGIDHIDLDYLKKQNITLSYAPGCNALAVATYVTTQLLHYSELTQYSKVGIIGFGHVGQRLAKLLNLFAIIPVVFDPFVDKTINDIHYKPIHSIEALIQQCSIIRLHTALTYSGPHPTYHLLNSDRLALLQPKSILINTSRGAVIDEKALQQLKKTNASIKIILDVFENEPHIDPNTILHADQVTPHIAGYGLDAKLTATQMICNDFKTFINKKTIDSNMALTANDLGIHDSASIMVKKLLAHYHFNHLHDQLRYTALNEPGQLSPLFQHLRNHYPLRPAYNTLT